MIRLSFVEQEKIKACVALGAPVHDLFTSPKKLQQMPKMYLDLLASRLGKSAVDINSMVRTDDGMVTQGTRFPK